MPERTATTVSFFFLSATTLRLVSSAISSHCLLASLSFIPLFCSPAFSYGGEKRWSQGYSFSIGAMQNRDVCKQTKRSSANVPKEQKRKYAMCVSASSALRERLSNTHLSKTTQREEKNKKRRKRKHQARGNEVTVCHNLFERQDQVSRCRPETTMAAL